MKWKSIGRAALATGMSLAIGLGATACSRDYVVAYVYATSSTNASVSAYAVDYESGALTQVTGSPFTGTGRNPVTIVAAPSGKFVYVINHDDSSVTVFAVGTDGKLYGQQTPSLTPTGGSVLGGTYPTSAAVDSTGSYLYVAFSCQPQYSAGCQPASTTTTPGPGGVTIFPIAQSTSQCSPAAVGSLCPPVMVNGEPYVPVGDNPVGIAVSNPATGTGNVYVYVLDQEASPNATIIGFQQNTTTGGLTLLSGSTCSSTGVVPCVGYSAGVTPSAIVVDPTARFVYVTDKTSNQVYGYGIANSTTTTSNNGNLTAVPGSPTATGSYPVGLTIEPRGKFLFTANYNAATVGGYAINTADGSLSAVSSTGTAQVGTGPTCVTVEPALGIYLYTSNELDNSISAEKVDANTGQLSGIPNTPFPSAPLLSCAVAVANGSHAQSVDNP